MTPGERTLARDRLLGRGRRVTRGVAAGATALVAVFTAVAAASNRGYTNHRSPAAATPPVKARVARGPAVAPPDPIPAASGLPPAPRAPAAPPAAAAAPSAAAPSQSAPAPSQSAPAPAPAAPAPAATSGGS